MKSRILIKIGGRAFEDEQGFRELATAILSTQKVEVIIVHGGGAEISQALKDAGRQTEFIDGIRVTQAEDIQIVEGVLSGTVNQRIAGWLEANRVSTARMSGKTDGLLIVDPLIRDGRDLGYVGHIKQVNPAVIAAAIGSGKVPVISPISANAKGESYNVNADSAAAALASAAHCTDLVFITDVPGVLIDNQIQPTISIAEAKTLISEGIIKGGMVAKMESAFAALNRGVPRVHIIEWQGSDTFQEIITRKSFAGTIIEL